MRFLTLPEWHSSLSQNDIPHSPRMTLLTLPEWHSSTGARSPPGLQGRRYICASGPVGKWRSQGGTFPEASGTFCTGQRDGSGHGLHRIFSNILSRVSGETELRVLFPLLTPRKRSPEEEKEVGGGHKVQHNNVCVKSISRIDNIINGNRILTERCFFFIFLLLHVLRSCLPEMIMQWLAEAPFKRWRVHFTEHRYTA